MCAASASASLPLFAEGTKYWRELTDECRGYVECVNSTLLRNGIDSEGLLQLSAGPESLQISKPRFPSTVVDLTLRFNSSGPSIVVTVRSQKNDGKNSLPKEFELPIAMDLDDSVVAIYDEGRSFSPHQVASYLTTHFHHCYGTIVFPC